MDSKNWEEWRNQIDYLLRSIGTSTIIAIWASTAYGQMPSVQSTSIEAHFRLNNSTRPRLGVRLSSEAFEATGKNFQFCDGTTALVKISTLIATDDTCTATQRQLFSYNIVSQNNTILALGPNYEEMGRFSSFDIDEHTGIITVTIDVIEDLQPTPNKKQAIFQLGKDGNSFVTDSNGKYELLVSDLAKGLWVDSEGCDHWIMDDGVEGYFTQRLDRYGKPVCSAADR